MFSKHMYDPEAFRNIVKDGKTAGFSFDCRLQYYRGATPSIIRNIEVEVDGKVYPRESVRLTLDGDTFTQEEMRTVIDYRWLFGKFATVSVMTEGGLAAGKHHIRTTQTIAPSYMPAQLVNSGEFDFEIK